MVVCGQSPFFDKACSGEFKEAFSGEIGLEDDDPEVVHVMLQYLYTKDYETEPGGTDEGPARSALVMHVYVHTIADKYGIPALLELATQKFSVRASSDWNTPAFADAINEMYVVVQDAKKGMYMSTVEITAALANELLNEECGASLRRVAETAPKFAASLAIAILNSKNEPAGVRYLCRNCGTEIVLIAPVGSDNPACSFCRRAGYQSMFLRVQEQSSFRLAPV